MSVKITDKDTVTPNDISKENATNISLVEYWVEENWITQNKINSEQWQVKLMKALLFFKTVFKCSKYYHGKNGGWTKKIICKWDKCECIVCWDTLNHTLASGLPWMVS